MTLIYKNRTFTTTVNPIPMVHWLGRKLQLRLLIFEPRQISVIEPVVVVILLSKSRTRTTLVDPDILIQSVNTD